MFLVNAKNQTVDFKAEKDCKKTVTVKMKRFQVSGKQFGN